MLFCSTCECFLFPFFQIIFQLLRLEGKFIIIIIIIIVIIIVTTKVLNRYE
jgi:hypothetical protein